MGKVYGMYCKHCGSPIGPGDVFCDQCGQAVTQGASRPGPTQEWKLSRPKFSGKGDKFVIAGAILLGVLMIWWWLEGGPVANTKEIVFESYGNLPIGEAAEQNLTEVSWDAESNGDGSYTVTVRGTYTDTEGKAQSRIGMDFHYTEADGYCWANAERAFVDGEYYKDDATLTMVMALIYGDEETAAYAMAWALIS